jgi:hypothetical protein
VGGFQFEEQLQTRHGPMMGNTRFRTKELQGFFHGSTRRGKLWFIIGQVSQNPGPDKNQKFTLANVFLRQIPASDGSIWAGWRSRCPELHAPQEVVRSTTDRSTTWKGLGQSGRSQPLKPLPPGRQESRPGQPAWPPTPAELQSPQPASWTAAPSL